MSILIKHNVRHNKLNNIYHYRYLATGDLLLSIALAYRIGESTASSVIKHTCMVLNKVLSPLYLAPPTSEKWKEIAANFLQDWNIPNCVGSFDGKHINIQAPPNSGSVYFNYKKNFSIVLMAACDSNYKFTLIDVGANGSISDGSIFASSEIGQAIKHEELDVPQGQIQLPGSDESTPYFFIGDQAFPLMKNFMRPYAGRRLEEKKQIFNYRLSRARRTIENAFGILSARWRVFRRPICLDLKAVDQIVISTVCLHNFLKTQDEKCVPEKRLYCPSHFIDSELENGKIIGGTWRDEQMQSQQIRPTNAHRATRNAIEQRDILGDYFVSQAGEIPWQYDYVRRGTHAE